MFDRIKYFLGSDDIDVIQRQHIRPAWDIGKRTTTTASTVTLPENLGEDAPERRISQAPGNLQVPYEASGVVVELSQLGPRHHRGAPDFGPTR